MIHAIRLQLAKHIPNLRSVAATATAFALVAPPCAPVTQAQERAQRENSNHRQVDSSDLARENADRVAASAAQLRGVLLTDPGMMVELKHWVAREATNNGQIVEDSALTDRGILERLDRDVAFRAVATRLLQRFGYLQPSVNPNSDAGRVQDIVVKERAKRAIQVEIQQEAEAARLAGDASAQQKLASVLCDPQRDANCANSAPPPAQGQPAAPPPAQQQQNITPPTQPDFSPSTNLAQTLRASRDENSIQLPLGSEPNLMLTSGLNRRSEDGSGNNIAALLGNEQMAGQSRTRILDSLSSPFDLEPTRAISEPSAPANNIVRLAGNRGGPAKDYAPVSIEHKSNPYSDVPSLYDLYVQASSRDHAAERFGLEMFRNGTRDRNAIPIDMPVGPDYVLGPGDGLAIDLWGGVSQRLSRTVDREGRIMLPEVGPIPVSGRPLSDVQQVVQAALRTQFQEVSADVSVSKFRTVRVYLVGEVLEPGAYDISALSTPLNALFSAGGVTPRGSLRALKHYRGKQLIEEVDAYDLLLRGVSSDAKRLESGDSLLVPPVGPQITVNGMVRRPAIYELHGEKTLADIIELAGGVLPAAALQHVELQRLEAHAKRTMLSLELSPNADAEALMKQMTAIPIQDGDEIHIFPIAPYNESAIYLQGHVLRPGRYSYRDGMKLSDVISSYGDLLPEPSGHYAEIVRLNAPDFRPSVESFDLTAALASPNDSPKLQPLDTIRIFSRYDFEPAPTISITGEVNSPGKYRTSGQARLRDAIYLAGGTSQDASLEGAQLFRTESDGTLKIVSVNLRGALAGDPSNNILLQPRDRLLIHRTVATADPPTVYVKGEVAKPGRYPLTGNMHVEDLIAAAGGLKRTADKNSADLTSYSAAKAASGDDSAPLTQSRRVELSAALTGDNAENVSLREGDVLTVRRNPGWNDVAASATIQGEVVHPGSFGIRPGENLSSLLERAGGFGPQAYPYGAVLTRTEVRDLEMKSYDELVQRVKLEQVHLRSLPEDNNDQRNAKLTAIAQTETALNGLQENQPVGRVVIHIQPDAKNWRNSVADIPLRDGDVLTIPKKSDYVTVTGQVFNPTAISFRPGHSANWYLSQAGGMTQLANKKAAFVIRADGSVLSAKNNSNGFWTGNPLDETLKPGDSIVVPERAPNVGGRNWQNIFQAAQVASSLAFAVAYLKP
jgi:protein involved in polysaccharide export with SLBB domain